MKTDTRRILEVDNIGKLSFSLLETDIRRRGHSEMVEECHGTVPKKVLLTVANSIL